MNKFSPLFSATRRFTRRSSTKFPPISLYIPKEDPLPEEINVIWNFAKDSSLNSTEKVKYVMKPQVKTTPKKEDVKEDTDHRIRAGLCAVRTLSITTGEC